MAPLLHARLLLDRAPIWLAALWWGSLSTVGFLVVPLLFVHLPTPAMAGAMAAKLFTAQTWVSVVCGLLLLLLSRREKYPEQANTVPAALIFIAGGMLLALLLEFAVAPRIVTRENLALWHRVGTGMYVLQWLCAAVVLGKVSRKS
jgi:hypothetical protein